MRMRVFRRKLTAAVVCCVSVGTMLMVSAAPASAGPTDGAAEFGVRFRDNNQNGQCRVESDPPGDVTTWAALGQWTRYLAIDSDDRDNGCQLWFGLNNKDGSLTGMSLDYTFVTSPGGDGSQCAFPNSSPLSVKPFPLALDWPVWTTREINLDSDDSPGYCILTLMISGRTDVELDVRYWYVDGTNPDQCKSAAGPGPIQVWTVTHNHPVSIGLDTDGRSGACFLAFRLRHL